MAKVLKKYRLADHRVAAVTPLKLRMANIPDRYWDVSIKKMNPSPAKGQLARYLLSIHEQAQIGRGLFIYGPFDSGKTSSAVSILKEAMRRNGTAYFLPARDILQAAYDNAEAPDGDLVRYKIQQVDFLLLDDLGAEGFDSHKGGGAVLEGIFRDRYDRRLPIIVTSNYPPTKLRTAYTEAIVNIIKRIVAVVSLPTKWTPGKEA